MSWWNTKKILFQCKNAPDLKDNNKMNFPKYISIIWLLNILTLRVPDEGYSTDVPCALKDEGVGMIRVNFDPISETVYIDIIINTIIKR